MSIILKSVQIAHVFGVLIFASVFLYNLSVKSEAVQDDGETGKHAGHNSHSGALTIVAETSYNSDEDDGVITVEGNESVGGIDESLEEFIPTDEWKTVKDGQTIPPGLHIRMDMQTGKKEAKLMVQDTAQSIERWDAGEKIGIINTEKKRYTRDELKEALKEFKYNDEPSSKEHEEEVKNKFRSIDELKKVLKDMNMSVKSEGEIVTELEKELKQKDIEHDRLKIVLLDLEYYLHQIDNARIFSDLGGLKTLLNLMNSTEEDIRETATFTLGAALQSNSKVQVAAVDTGALQQLLKLVSVDPSILVRKKALFALSTLLRQFPYAQKKFLHFGGLSALTELFVDCKDDGVKIKIVTLLTDLLLEYDINVNSAASDDPVQAQRSLQYQEVGLRDSLVKTGWCSIIISMLHSSSGHDNVEKVVTAMLSLTSVCRDEFSPTRPKLQALLSEYQELANEEVKEGSSDVFTSIFSAIQRLVKEVHRVDL
uniref:Nucleotide exchange factor SIL1 n=1 Tax=Arion vulgaris TaxID=1028688 RepID=A0A0B7A9W9_9EUPU